MTEEKKVIEWLGALPKTWEISKINGQYELRNEKVSDVDYPPLSVTKQGILPQLDTVAKTNAHDDRKLVRIGDFAINSRSDRRGSCGISNYDGSVSLINTVLKPRKTMCPKYYDWLFHTVQFADEFYKWGHGIVDDLWTTNWQDMKKINVPVPPIEEQEKIADFLDSKCSEIDAISAKIQEQIATLEEYKKFVITEAVTKGLDPNAEMIDSGIDYIGKIPKNWSIKRLKYILNERNERSKTGIEKLLSVSQYKGVIPSDELTQRTMQANNLIGYKKVYKNDLVFNKLNPGLARFGASNYTGITSPDFAVYIVDECCSAKYLQHVLKSNLYVTKIKSLSIGVGDGFTRLYTPQLYEFCIAIPNRAVVDEIIDYIDKFSINIDAIIEDKQKQLETLEEYKKTMIYEYVTGKKEVV